MTTEIKIGDILTYSFNYNCCRPQFVRVIRRTKSFIWVEELLKTYASGDWMNGYEMPNLDAEPRKCDSRFKIISTGGTERVKINGHYAYVWDGTPQMSYCD